MYVGSNQLANMVGVSSNISLEADQEIRNCPIEESQPKKRRGPTKMKTIAADGGKAIEIQFNEACQPIGQASIGMSSFLGPLVREIVPITIDSWKHVPQETKDILWACVKVTCKTLMIQI